MLDVMLPSLIALVAKAIKAVGDKPSVTGLPGMASEVWESKRDGRGGFRVHYPQTFLHKGVAYVRYDAPRELVEDKKRTMCMGVPDKRWEPIKLSEYHLALEAYTEAAA